MLRILCAIIVLSALGRTFAVEAVLGECAAGSDTIRLSVRDDASGNFVFAISAGNAVSRQSFNLKTPLLPKLHKALASDLKIDAIDAADANSLVVGFAMDCDDGDAKWVSVWLNKSTGRWMLRGEWTVEKFNHKELGEKSETQSFAFESGALVRRVNRNILEGIKTTCPAGCCVVWHSKTTVTEDLETLAWNELTRSAERNAYRKWYVVQHGEGVLLIAQKVFADASRMATLLNLNPELQKQETLRDDQKILVEKFPR